MFVFHIILLSFFCAETLAKNVNDADGPLDLTAYLERGEADKARKLSAVDPTLFAGVQSHAAFFNVNKTNKWHTFFWFFPAENKPLDSSPWILWLGGSWGQSTLHQLFYEMGPLHIENRTAFRTPFAWNSDYPIVYVDNPVHAGFSYSEKKHKYVKNFDEGGQCLYSFIQQFVQVFPELQKAPLFIGGSDYASRYSLSLGRIIHNHKNAAVSINLKGFVFNTPWVDPASYLHYSDLASQLGFIDYGEAAEMRQNEEAARKAYKEGNMKEYHRFYDAVYQQFAPYFFMSVNPSKYTENFFLEIPKYVSFLNKAKVREALHVGDVQFRLVNYVISDKLRHLNYEQSDKALLEETLEHYAVLCYHGQLDFMNGYALSEHMYRDLKWSGAQDYLNATRTTILSENPAFTKNPLGFSKGAGNFVEVMIRSAGHFPTDQPASVTQVVRTFIEQFK